MRPVLVAFLTSGLASEVVSQATLLVGPGGYPQISAAIAAAQPGDIVKILPGTYEPFTVPFALHVLSLGAVVRPPGTGSSSSSATGFQPPPGQTVIVSGLTFESNTAVHSHSVVAAFGQVVFVGCVFRGGHPYKVARGLGCSAADVVLLACSFDTRHACVRVQGGSLVANSTTFLASMLAQIPEPLVGVDALNASVQLTGCTLQGANSLLIGHAYPAAIAAGTSTMSLAMCTATGGNAQIQPGAPGVRNLTASPIRHWQSTVTGGQGSVNGQPANGVPFQGLEVATTLLTTMSSSPTTTPFAMTNLSEPGRLIAVGMSFDLASPTAVPFAAPHVRFDPSTVVPWSFGVTDAGGFYMSPPTVAAGPAAFGRTLWLHPLLLDGGSFIAGTPAGLVIH